MPQLLPKRPSLKIAPNRGLGVVITSNETVYNGEPTSGVNWLTWGDMLTFDELAGKTFNESP